MPPPASATPSQATPGSQRLGSAQPSQQPLLLLTQAANMTAVSAALHAAGQPPPSQAQLHGLSQGLQPGLGGTPAGSQQVLTPLSAADIAAAAAEGGLGGGQLVDRQLLTQLASQQVRAVCPRTCAAAGMAALRRTPCPRRSSCCCL
jgi:hypothetical protein